MRPRTRWRTLRYRLDPARLVFVERDQDQDQHGATAGLGAEGAPPEGHRPARALAHRDLPGRPAPGRVERAARVRLADQPALLPDLGGAALGADAPARRSLHPRQPRQRQEEGRPRGDPPGQCAAASTSARRSASARTTSASPSSATGPASFARASLANLIRLAHAETRVAPGPGPG